MANTEPAGAARKSSPIPKETLAKFPHEPAAHSPQRGRPKRARTAGKKRVSWIRRGLIRSYNFLEVQTARHKVLDPILSSLMIVKLHF